MILKVSNDDQVNCDKSPDGKHTWREFNSPLAGDDSEICKYCFVMRHPQVKHDPNDSMSDQEATSQNEPPIE